MNSNDYYKIITNIYRKYNPQKVNDVSNLLSKYEGNEELLLQSILAKYNISDDEKVLFYNINRSSSSTTSNEIADKKIELQKNLERIKNLYDTKAINEDSYLKQKEDIEKKIEILNFNDTTPIKEKQFEEILPTEFENKKNSVIGILIGIIIILISFLGYLMYDGQTKSFNLDKISSIFSSHSKDKEEIKSQLEKAYLNLANGIYTAEGFKGLDSEGLPFYNTDLKSFTAMGIIPLAQLFGKVQIETSNIEISDFDDKNETANLKYDISVIFNNDTMKGSINMITKKIGGQWKFDAEKFFGEKQQEKREKQSYKNDAPKSFEYKYQSPSENRTEVMCKTYYTDDLGYGYDILVNDRIFIHQEFIPAIKERKGFKNREQAAIIGNLVLEKLKKHESIVTTKGELDSYGIEY